MTKVAPAGASKPRGEGYAYKKRFYRRDAVAADYDRRRFEPRHRRARNTRKWKTILGALEETAGVRSILDLPCGTGRFTGSLARRGYRVFGCDISHEMMRRAQAKDGAAREVGGYFQADAEALPLRDRSFDCVLSIRFMFHVDPVTRVSILREMARVSRRWLIVDYRHRYSLRYARWKLQRALGRTDRTLERVSRAQLEQEFHDAGVSIRKVLPVTRVFSDKWIVVGESRSAP